MIYKQTFNHKLFDLNKIDLAVHKHVMGEKDFTGKIPFYSRNMTHAMRLVKHMSKNGPVCCFKLDGDLEAHTYCALFIGSEGRKHKRPSGHDDSSYKFSVEVEEKAPLAICLAALNVFGKEPESFKKATR